MDYYYEVPFLWNNSEVFITPDGMSVDCYQNITSASHNLELKQGTYLSSTPPIELFPGRSFLTPKQRSALRQRMIKDMQDGHVSFIPPGSGPEHDEYWTRHAKR